MARPAICVENLSKKYQLAHDSSARSKYSTLRESVTGGVATLAKRIRGRIAHESEDFWALNDVSFDVQPGEVVGIIGRNGAGKSTLLKILSRITKPTSGRVVLSGRVGSLLEVGTGFHPELTGRENIYLNGSILGMTRREIDRKFDEIVAFAEVEKFLDTPVKRYSSGMYVRLAFAVAAHLEPEILIVDEVLAVGDIAFQRKCMGRMHDVGRDGTTVLFVSHNMPAIESLCTRAVLLHEGRFVDEGEVQEVVAEYRRRIMGPIDSSPDNSFDRPSPDRHQKVMRSALLIDDGGQPTNYVQLGGTFRLRIKTESRSPIRHPTIGIGIDDQLGQRVLTVHTPLTTSAIDCLSGCTVVECQIEQLPLIPGEYWITLAVSAGDGIDTVARGLQFAVVNGDAFGEGRGFHRGFCVAPSRWTVVGLNADRLGIG